MVSHCKTNNATFAFLISPFKNVDETYLVAAVTLTVCLLSV
jgi:hypothetical protein